jgi:tetratricopeptide (TPR) repeat protein
MPRPSLSAQGRYAQAQPLYEKALAIRKKVLGEEHPDTARGYNSLAVNLNHQGQYAQAQPLLEKALAIRKKMLGEEHPDTAMAFANLGINLVHQEKPREALHYLQPALAGYDIGRIDSNLSGFDRSLFAAATPSPRPVLAVALAQLGRSQEAWQQAEADLARGLLDDLPGKKTESADDPRPRLTRVRRLDVLLVPLLTTSKLPAARLQQRDDLLRQRKQLLAELSRQAAQRSAGKVLSLKRIQEQIPADAALVYWLDAEHQFWGCVLRREGPPRWEKLPGSGAKGLWTREERDLWAKLYSALTHPTGGADAQHQKLTQALLKQHLTPLEKHFRARGQLPAVRKLLVVPIGGMAFVPLETLTRAYTVSYVPSGSVFARLAKGHRPLRGRSLLALGDPVFAPPRRRRPEPPRHGLLVKLVLPRSNAARAGLQSGDVLLSYGSVVLKKVTDLKVSTTPGRVPARCWREGRERQLRLAGGPLGLLLDHRPAPVAVAAWREAETLLALRGTGHRPLPGTRWEVQALARLVGPARATVLLGSQASEQEIDRLRRDHKLKSYRLLHLATHGQIDRDRPSRSALILAQDRLPDPVEAARTGRKVYSGELRVSTILADWELDCDLVVLSACETGLGKDAGGEGLLGFAQAFLQKGARAVVLTRWQVDDTATALLMLRFYENLLGKRKGLQKGLGRAAALAEAKQWLRNLRRRDVERLAAGLAGGVVRGTEVEALPLVKAKPPKLPSGERPFAHPFYWAAFVLFGDPD